MHQSIRTSKVLIKVIRTSKIEKIRTRKSLPMVYYLWIIRPVGVRLGQAVLGQVRSHYVRLGYVRLKRFIFQCQNAIGRFNLWNITHGYQGLWGVRLGSFRLGQVRLGQVRLNQVKKAKCHRQVTFDVILIFSFFDVLMVVIAFLMF